MQAPGDVDLFPEVTKPGMLAGSKPGWLSQGDPDCSPTSLSAHHKAVSATVATATAATAAHLLDIVYRDVEHAPILVAQQHRPWDLCIQAQLHRQHTA